MFGFGCIDIKTLQKSLQPKESFDDYFNKRYFEEIKDFIKQPKISMKHFMIMGYIRESIREKSKKEYIKKYHLCDNFFDKNISHNIKMHIDEVNEVNQVNQVNEVNEIDYDVINEADYQVLKKNESKVEGIIVKEIKNELTNDSSENYESIMPLRRSERLKNKVLTK